MSSAESVQAMGDTENFAVVDSKLSDDDINALDFSIAKFEPVDRRYPTTFFNMNRLPWASTTARRGCTPYALTEVDALAANWQVDSCCSHTLCNFGRGHCTNTVKSAMGYVSGGGCSNGPYAPSGPIVSDTLGLPLELGAARVYVYAGDRCETAPGPFFTVVSGPCTVSEGERCVGRPDGYLPNEECEITVTGGGRLGPCPVFDIDCDGCSGGPDPLTMPDGSQHFGVDCPTGYLAHHDALRWSSSDRWQGGSVDHPVSGNSESEHGQGGGWQICFTKPTAGLPAWDSGALRSTGNPAGAAFTLFKLPAMSLNQGDTVIYTAACAEYGLQGIGCYGPPPPGEHWSDYSDPAHDALHMPHQFGCNLWSGNNFGGDPNQDLGSLTGWHDLVYYSSDSLLNGMGADGEDISYNGVVDGRSLSPVCAQVVRGECRTGWTPMADGQRCVQVFAAPTISWDAAEADCVQRSHRGGHLVRIGSEADNDQLVALGVSQIPDPGDASVWIGFRRASNAGEWSWTDGEADTFRPHTFDTDDGSRGAVCSQSYLEFASVGWAPGSWNDAYCEGAPRELAVVGYACEVAATLPTAGLPSWDSGDLRSTGNPAVAAFTLYKLPEARFTDDDGGVHAYTAACAEYGLQGIGCRSSGGCSDLTEFNPPGMHMPVEFGCDLSDELGSSGRAESDRLGGHDLGASTGWTNLVFYQCGVDVEHLMGMFTNGQYINAETIQSVLLSPVCALAH